VSAIADLFGRLLLDDTGFEADVVKSASKAGDAASKTMSGRISSGFKTWGAAGVKIAAGAIATGLGIATAQGLELNGVLNDLQAETGAVGDDWEGMQKVVRRENGRTTESLDGISAAVKSMRQDLGLTGDEIGKYSDRIFDAGLATKTSGAIIAGAVDDIGDSYNVSIDTSLAAIDRLIVGQEKWGGNLQERISALPGFARAILGLGGTIDDAIALENVAVQKGLDMGDVQKALNAAVGKFKLPKDLKTLLGAPVTSKTPLKTVKADLQKIEDELKKFLPPTAYGQFIKEIKTGKTPLEQLRIAQRLYAEEVAKFRADPIQAYLDILTAIPDAQARTTRAIELFGPKAGPIWATLAGQIADAGGSLDAFNVTQAEAAGKATEVARRIDSGPTRSLQLLGEKLGAVLANLGQTPAITGLASLGTIIGGFAPTLGPDIAKGILGGIKGIGGKILKAVGIEMAESTAANAGATAAGDTIGTLTAAQVAKRLAGKESSDLIGDGVSSALGAGAGTAVAENVGIKAAALGLARGLAGVIGGALLEFVVIPLVAGTAIALVLDKLFPGLAEQIHDQFFRGLQIAEDAVAHLGERIHDGFVAGLGSLRQAFTDVATAIVADVTGFASDVSSRFGRGLDNVATTARTTATEIHDAFVRGLSAVTDAISTTLQGIGDAIGGAFGALGDAFPKTRDALRSLSKDLLGIGDNVITVVGQIEDFVGIAVAAISDLVGEVETGVGSVVRSTISEAQQIFGVVSTTVGQVASSVQAAFASVVAAASAAFGSVVGSVVDAASRIVAPVATAVGQVVDNFLAVPAGIARWVGSIVGQAVSLAGEVVASIAGMASGVVSTVLAIPGNVASWVGTIVAQAGELARGVIGAIDTMVAAVIGFFHGIPGAVADVGGRIVGSIIGGMASLPGRLAESIRQAFASLNVDVGPFHISGSGITIDLPNIGLPGKAAGGALAAGELAVVGERGPELFAPRVSGTIIPADLTSRIRSSAPAGGNSLQINVTANGTPLHPATPDGDRHGDAAGGTDGRAHAEPARMGPERCLRSSRTASATAAPAASRRRAASCASACA
jgi:hypothetical protein